MHPPQPPVEAPHRLGQAMAGLFLGALVALPRAWVRALASGLARLAYLLGFRRKVTLQNLAAALPELPAGERARIARSAYVRMAWAFAEGLIGRPLTGRASPAVELEGYERLEAALAEGKGLLLASAHLGSWELLGAELARRGLPLWAVARPLRGAFNQRLVQSRLCSGVRLIPPRGAVQGTLAALRKGGAVMVMLDQVVPAERGVFVPFFGLGACTSPALSVAALRSGAPVLVVAGVREGAGLRLRIEGPFPPERTGDLWADVTRHTARLTGVLEANIRRCPEQWLWLHRRWKVAPPADGEASTGRRRRPPPKVHVTAPPGG